MTNEPSNVQHAVDVVYADSLVNQVWNWSREEFNFSFAVAENKMCLSLELYVDWGD